VIPHGFRMAMTALMRSVCYDHGEKREGTSALGQMLCIDDVSDNDSGHEPVS